LADNEINIEETLQMKIMIADKVSPDMITEFESLGGIVTYSPNLKAEDIPDSIADAAILIVRSTKVTAETIEAGQSLRLIVRAGAGVNTIDLNAASDRGIYVANCPGMNTAAVAEVAIGLLIAADRGIANATVALRDGQWLKGEFGKAAGLLGRTLGVVGVGQIGNEVIVRAKALGMKVVAWSRSLTPERAEAMGVEYAPDPVALASQADAVSVHLAATADTKHLLGSEFFGAMKPGSIFINTARGEVVDTEALVAAVDEKGLRVGLDVFENEPAGGKADFPHTALAEKVTCTPHIGASTDQASQAIASETVRIVAEFIKTGEAPNVVNMRPPATELTHVVVRHKNIVGVIASILGPLRDQGINIEEMRDAPFHTSEAACCLLTLDTVPTGETLSRIREANGVISVEV
jgi:D-3-phosphoglycerate dehydrogenase